MSCPLCRACDQTRSPPWSCSPRISSSARSATSAAAAAVVVLAGVLLVVLELGDRRADAELAADLELGTSAPIAAAVVLADDLAVASSCTRSPAMSATGAEVGDGGWSALAESGPTHISVAGYAFAAGGNRLKYVSATSTSSGGNGSLIAPLASMSAPIQSATCTSGNPKAGSVSMVISDAIGRRSQQLRIG